MNDYGKTIRKIRREKGFSIEQLSEGIVSTSFLSKFERGNSDITVGYFFKILDKLSLSYDEFLFIHHNFKLDHFHTFFEQAELAYVKRDIRQLKRLKEIHSTKWRTTKIETYRCNTVVLDVLISVINNEVVTAEKANLDFLFHYLFKVEVWGYYELRLYNTTLFFMEPETVLTLSKTAYLKSNDTRRLTKINKIIIYILLNTLTYFTKHNNYWNECKTFFQYLDNISIPETDLLSRNHYMYLQGIYEILIGNQDNGFKIVDKALCIFRDLGSTSLFIERDNFLREILSNSDDILDKSEK